MRIICCFAAVITLLLSCTDNTKSVENSKHLEKELNYPFSVSDSVVIYGYPLRYGYSEVNIIENGLFNVEGIDEKKNLDKDEIKKLNFILFHEKSNNRESTPADCFNPQHSIVFYKNGKAFSCLEICFLYSVSKSYGDTQIGNNLSYKYLELNEFFHEVGLTKHLDIN